MSALLEISDLSVRLPITGESRLVVDGVTLQIGAGEALGLAGESGSGKSMTARSVIRLLPQGAAVGGSVRFDGDQVLEMDAARLSKLRSGEVAMIFQDPRAHINPVRRVGDFLTEALVFRGEGNRRSARARVIDLLEQTGVDHPEQRLRQLPDELSGGLLQRVMIAAALADEPRLLIADEPTTALDVTTQADVMALLGELRRLHSLAMLFITHDLDLAATVCDRTAVMYAGRLVEVQPSSSLHERPLHPYTTGLGDSRPSVTGRAPRLEAIPGRPIAAFEASGGCSFAPRCPYAQARCRQERPPLRPLGAGYVACHRSEEILAGKAEHETRASV